MPFIKLFTYANAVVGIGIPSTVLPGRGTIPVLVPATFGYYWHNTGASDNQLRVAFYSMWLLLVH